MACIIKALEKTEHIFHLTYMQSATYIFEVGIIFEVTSTTRKLFLTEDMS